MKGLLAAMLVAAPAAADPCKPHAILEGDPQAVASVGAELGKLGVVVGADATSCKSVRATVEVGQHGGIAVAVEFHAQSEGRTVGDAAVAATWIDSWLQDDFGGPSFTTQLAAAPLVERGVDVKMPPAEKGLQISAAFDQAWTFDGSRWTGISAGACMQVGALCYGARGRYAGQSMLVGQTAARRTDLSVLATASYEKQLGRATVMPELGLGVGRMTTDRVDGCRQIQTCDPQDIHCMIPPVNQECIAQDPEHAYTLDLGDDLHASTVTPRAQASLRLAIALADHLWLDGLATVMLSPFDHGEQYGLPTHSAPPFGIPAAQLALPGESIGTFELGIGLRWGSR